ncbi:putative transmembrane protein [Toxoplasma gondii TgCatPRC2]|uniref:Putative transmembrane protein n=1 Tax=Toxoplasma gondii TgCatPRC2 TaxID=1130821 RepID=A0A151H0X0_TOXGO|nr:putative transmembrane protein [Toxoplasma gondii TgCatPRC2]
MARMNLGAACLAALLVAVCMLAVSPAAVGAEETHTIYNPVDMFLSMFQTNTARENADVSPSRVFLPMLFPPPVPPQPQNVYHKHVHHLPKKPHHKPHGHPESHPQYPPFHPPQPRYF